MSWKATTIDFARMLKRCARCREYKALEAFPSSRNIKQCGFHGRQAYCRPCGLQINAEWRDRNRPRKDGKPATAGTYFTRSSDERRLDRNKKQRIYAKANPEKVRFWNKARMHRQRAGGPMPHRYEVSALCCEQEHLCTYCRELLPLRWHIDHKTPVSRGGSNEVENLQALCMLCNIKKGTKTHEEYMHRLGRMG